MNNIKNTPQNTTRMASRYFNAQQVLDAVLDDEPSELFEDTDEHLDIHEPLFYGFKNICQNITTITNLTQMVITFQSSFSNIYNLP